MTEKFTQLYLPKGEWLDATLTALKAVDLEVQSSPRCYEYRFVSSRLPIVFQTIRTKEVWQDITDPETVANGGFTGSDIIYEQNAKPTRRWTFPLYELEPIGQNFPRPRICLGSTPNFRDQVQQPTIEDLNGKTIYTAYPKIAKDFFDRKKIKPKIVEKQGTTEGRWRTNIDNWAIIDVVSTGNTLRANGIEIMEDILTAELEYVEGPNMSPQDKLRVDYLVEAIMKPSY